MTDDKKNLMPKANDEKENIPSWAREIIQQNRELKEKVSMFESMAGENKIASWKDAQKDHSQKFATLRKYNGKVVVGWSSLNMEGFRSIGKHQDAADENILITLFYLNGEKEEVNYILFTRSKELINVKIKEFGQQTCVVEFPPEIVSEYKLENSQMEFPTKFLN